MVKVLLRDKHFYISPKRNIVDVLLEHVRLPHVLPLTVHLDLEHLPNTQHCMNHLKIQTL